MGDKILSLYGRLWEITQQMLEAAGKNERDELVRLERMRFELVSSLRGLDISGSPNQDRIAENIRNILATDGEIKSMVEGWMAELQGVIASVGNEKKLSETYDSRT
jgi:hypothetical protein